MFYFQCTEKDHEDRENLLEAVNIMTDVAAFINESKRRKDIGKFPSLFLVLLGISDVLSDCIICPTTQFKTFFIVDKYKTEEEKTLTRKISKLNMHSIGKKSSRIGQRFLSSIGIETSVSVLKIQKYT